MARNLLNQHNVDNLYIKRDLRSKSGYSCQYKDPRYGVKTFEGVKQYRSLGSDISVAIQKARQLNCIILPSIVEQRINEIVSAPTSSVRSLKLKNWCDKYCSIQEQKLRNGEIKPNTWRSKKHIVTAIYKVHGDIRLSSITTKLVKALLDTYVAQGKNRMAQSVRSTYTDLFIEAAQCGEVDSNFNPAKNTRKPKARVNKSRLSLEQFELICANQKYCSHKLTYLLALVTGQRRTDISLIRKNKGNDWDSRFEEYRQNNSYFMDKEGGYASFSQLVAYVPYSFIEKDYLHVFQLKTGKLIKIPLDLKLNKINLTIRDVVEQSNIIKESEFVVHHTTARACNSLGDPLHPDTVSKSFKRAREAAEIKWQANPATFHEIRSLSERLYREQGIDTKKLCGHSSQETTDMYNDLRGQDWEELMVN